MKVQKAGCVLINLETKKIGLVYRKNRDDFSFPKGHLEKGETLIECAIRETEEETGHICHIISPKELAILRFSNPIGEDVENYFYLAIDDGLTSRIIDIKDKEELVWKEFNEVEDSLSYDNLKTFWNSIKKEVRKILDNEKI